MDSKNLPEDDSKAAVLELVARGDERLDAFLAAVLTEISRSEAQRWIKLGLVSVEGHAARASDKPPAGARVVIRHAPPAPARLAAETIPLRIVYEDADLLVVDKPAGMTTHPGAGVRDGTLVNALLAHCGSLSVIGGEERPGIVHRLDRDTSGLLVVAKNDRAHRALSTQIGDRTAGREYVAIAWGRPAWNHAIVRAPVGRHPLHRTRMAVLPEGENGRSAETGLEVEERLELGCVLKATLKTGRTHQIRVHCEYAGFPLVGDPVYGRHRAHCQAVADPALRDRLLSLERQALHARRLGFTHPRTGERMNFEAEPPSDWMAILHLMRAAQGRA